MNVALCVLLFAAAYGQQDADSVSTADSSRSATVATAVIIETNVEGARVFWDGDSVGVTPLTINVEPGRHFVRIIPPDVQNWLSDIVEDSIEVEPQTHRSLTYNLNPKVLLLSTPSGAQVLAGDSVIGVTPLVVSTSRPSVRLKLQGFEEDSLEIANTDQRIISTHLKKTWNEDAEDISLNASDERRSPLRIYMAGAATLIAGSAAAYFKVKADNTYSDYQQTGDPGMLSKTDRLDAAAGIALAATQLSLGLFTYFILTE
ncbi:MAG: PEGA domain-containing protein [Ignavibacteriae bacterium]|nr:PEGA domain-containing protein [Ignavibacteriota bacterium]